MKGSVYLRGNTYWIKLGHPCGGEQVRFSLETADPARADLLARKIWHHFRLARPLFQGIVIPERIQDFLQEIGAGPIEPAVSAPAGPSSPPETSPPRIPVEEFLREYIAHIRTENAPRHAENKIGHLKAFFGTRRLGLGEDDGKFLGDFLEDVAVSDVRRFLEELPWTFKTKRHYRETFHHLFEMALRTGRLIPTNFRYPNPMSALPSYHTRNRVIKFLSAVEKEELLGVVKVSPSVEAGVRLMVQAGLRRAEALWLKRSSISPDLKFLSVVNQRDEENDIESTLKTGARAVVILPELRQFLTAYLPTLQNEWLVPSPTGKQWIGENFGDAHREILRAANLGHTCLHYRHTFATDRAREGWSLFRIAKTMGNSAAVCEEYYAAFVDPSLG